MQGELSQLLWPVQPYASSTSRLASHFHPSSSQKLLQAWARLRRHVVLWHACDFKSRWCILQSSDVHFRKGTPAFVRGNSAKTRKIMFQKTGCDLTPLCWSSNWYIIDTLKIKYYSTVKNIIRRDQTCAQHRAWTKNMAAVVRSASKFWTDLCFLNGNTM